VLAFVVCGVLALFGLGYFGRVEVTSVAPGALLVRGGPRPVLTQVSGEVMALEVEAGDVVAAGQEIARIAATELRAREQRSAEQVALVRDQQRRLAGADTRLFERGLEALRRKRAILTDRQQLKARAAEDRQVNSERLLQLAREGVASEVDALLAREARRSADEELLSIQQQIADIDLELNDRTRLFESERQALLREIAESEASLSEARQLIRQRAAAAGRQPVWGRTAAAGSRSGASGRAALVAARRGHLRARPRHGTAGARPPGHAAIDAPFDRPPRLGDR
jgi:multidrug efflux pump subunit AcrA (membrane-fusion protein)